MDRHEQIMIWGGKTMNEFFFRPDPARQLEMLLTRLAESNAMIRYIEAHVLSCEKVNRKRDESESITLDGLPPEILDMVYDCNDDLTDCVFLSLTSQRLWEIGKRHIIRIRDNLIVKNTWANTRIICAGDFQEKNDWPDGISMKEYDSYLTRYDWPDRSRSTWCLLSRFPQRFLTLNPSEMEIWNYLCKGYRMSNCFVLRNLSKKLYVRDEGLEYLFEGSESQPNPPLNLGHIVLAKICWSTSDYISMRYRGPIHRGEWAGDKLEIVPTFQHAKEVEEAVQSNRDSKDSMSACGTKEASVCEWKDVTDECMRLMEDVWTAI